MGIVYCHTINGKSYVGYTKYDIEKRLSQHVKKAEKGSKLALHCSIRKHGAEAISSEILEECDDALLPEREKYWISKLGTYKGGLNMTEGGDGGNTGLMSPEIRVIWREKVRMTWSEKEIPKMPPGNKCGKYEKSEDHKRKLAGSPAKWKWVSKDGISRRVHEDQLDDFLQAGYIRGRSELSGIEPANKGTSMSDQQKEHLRKETVGRIHIFNPDTGERKMIWPNELQYYQQNGFKRGRK